MGCIWGCSGEDDTLCHYLCCDCFWSAIVSAAGMSAGTVTTDPLCKLCLLAPSPVWGRLLAVGHACYHTVKMNHRSEVQSCVDSDSFEICHALLHDLAGHFWKEFAG